jgi:hypothetical protein
MQNEDYVRQAGVKTLHYSIYPGFKFRLSQLASRKHSAFRIQWREGFSQEISRIEPMNHEPEPASPPFLEERAGGGGRLLAWMPPAHAQGRGNGLFVGSHGRTRARIFGERKLFDDLSID